MGTKYGKKYNYNLNIFKNEDELSFYLLGVLMTDGCVKSNANAITLRSKDKDWITIIRDLICPDIKIYQENNSWTFGIYSKELKQWLISKGCVPKKSLTLNFPLIPKPYLSDFIRGCIDGDGSLGIYNGISRIYLCSSSYQFIDNASKILTSLSIKNYLYKTNQPTTFIINDKLAKRNSDHWRLEIYRHEAKKLAQLLYYSNHKLSLNRKNLLAQKIINSEAPKLGRKPNIEKQNKACELKDNGYSLQEIAKELKTSKSRVHYWTSKKLRNE